MDTNLIFSKSFSFDIFMPVMNSQLKKYLANVSLGLVIQIQINATQQEQPTKLSENFDEVKVKSLKINESIYVLKSEGGGIIGVMLECALEKMELSLLMNLSPN